MLIGTVPFKAGSMKDLHSLIKQGIYKPPVDISKGNQNLKAILDAKNIIEGLIRLKPENRLSIPNILIHPWLKKDEDFEESTYLGKEECVNPGKNEGQPDINDINVDNLFFLDDKSKLSYSDYCNIANDFYTQHLSIRK